MELPSSLSSSQASLLTFPSDTFFCWAAFILSRHQLNNNPIMCFKVKAKLTQWRSESCWVLSGLPPSLILLPLCGLGSCTGFDCWWRDGTCLDMLCCLDEADAETEREREATKKQKKLVVNWSLCEETLQQPVFWMEELCRCLAPWWVWIISYDFMFELILTIWFTLTA